VSKDFPAELKQIRREAVIWKEGPNVGGTLTLTPNALVWERSRWAFLQKSVFQDGPPKKIELKLADLDASSGPRRPSWLTIILLPAWGWLWELLTGGFRKTLAVKNPYATYLFKVKDVESWLHAITTTRDALDL